MASLKAIAAIALTLVVAVPILMGYGMASEETTVTSWEASNTSNITEVLYNTSTNYYTTYAGTTNNSILDSSLTPDYVSVSDTITSYPSYTVSTVSITFSTSNYSMSAYESWSFVAPSSCYVTYYTDSSSSTDLYSTGDTVTGTGDAYVSLSSGSAAVDVTVYTDDGQYADITAGWRLPNTSNTWKNKQTNSQVIFTIYLPSGSEVGYGPVTLTNTDGTVTMSWSLQGNSYSYTLGSYSYLRVVQTLDGITAYGLTGWPEYGITPTTYNSVEYAYSSTSSEFTTVSLENDDQAAIFRVESAEIVAGSYPVTSDYWAEFDTLYPEQNIAVTFKSVSTYGTGLMLGVDGEEYELTDNTITVTDLDDGEDYTLKVRGMVVKMFYDSDEGTYTTYANGHMINTDGNGGIYFSGLWSLTASLDTLTETTSTQQTWAAGEFAFDKEDFAACGLIVAGLCMVGLGMTGARSGAKMGVLLIICGGAGLIYLTLI